MQYKEQQEIMLRSIMYRQYCEVLESESRKTTRQSDRPSKKAKGVDEPDSKKTGKQKMDENTPKVKEYTYGNKRKRQPFWERDIDLYNCVWKDLKKAPKVAEAEKVEKSSPPPREKTPEPKPKPKPAKEHKLAKVLHVKNININIAENAKNHKTDTYDCVEDRKYEDGSVNEAELVLRRGNFFKITLTLDRPFNGKTDDLRIGFEIGRKPNKKKGTGVMIKIDEDGQKTFPCDEWGGYVESQSGNDINVMVHIPATCIIGEWSFYIKTISKGKDKNGKDKTEIYCFEYEGDVTIVFNPWCKDDGVYMEDSKLLEEYVLNESGCVYRGNAWTRGAKPWNFGQFDDGILDICLYLLRCATDGCIGKAMADPVRVVRLIAQIVNSCDDNGVLTGNWSGKYDDGVSPSDWIGSPKILKQFRKSGPVKYGQCWVFSCLTTTVCRALGIPCRTVTNFASAHDQNGTNSVEKIFSRENGKLKKTPDYDSDSVWNFHVWNEVYMERPDLKEKDYGGWQVIDATPQETSDGVYTCGPCPVKAVKEGNCNVNYDTGFVFAEVNADDLEVEKLVDGSYKVLLIQKNRIGKNISTKIPDGKPFKDETFGVGGMNFKRDEFDEKKRLDLTDHYKYPHDSEEERRAIIQAHKTAVNPLIGAYNEPTVVKDVKLNMRHSNEVMIGETLSVELCVKNIGTRERDITYAGLTFSPKTYSGQRGNVFLDHAFEPTKLAPGAEKSFTLDLKQETYLKHLIEQANIEIEGTINVAPVEGQPDTEQDSSKIHDFRFRRPDLEVKCPADAKKGAQVEFCVTFKNPLPVPLTGCKISMDSSGFKNVDDIKQPDVPANGVFDGKFTMVAKKTGYHSIGFSFDCKELKDISGDDFIDIQ